MGIPENIKRLRESHNLSQEEFGKIANVSDKAVSSWENGTREPRMGAIQKLADYFGIQKSDIIEDRDNPSYYLDPETARLAQELKDNPEYRILMDASRSLTPEALREVMNFIKFQKAKEEPWREDD
nr:MAG TPA: Repressor protein CI [Caudoviricetes sp.]